MVAGEADGTVAFDVRLAEQGLSPVNVNYSTVNGTAVGSSSCTFDFKPKSGTLTFAVGDLSEHVSVEINNCADVEGLEAFTLRLSSAVNGTIARASSHVSMVDNDTVVTTPRIVARDAVVDERDGTAFVSVLLGGTAGQASSSIVTVHYATNDDAAAPVARSFSIASPSPPPPPPPPVPREPAATPAPGPRDTEIVYDPKRKTFLINVQYVLRNRSCRNPCPARAEIRTRNGRRLYAAGTLPGDGRVVLGTRRGINIPRGRKVFFYIPIKVAQLRKVHFKTVRGYRYGETRLRVWLRTPTGEALTIRDGRIRVSIARIKSGALPNLRGIL